MLSPKPEKNEFTPKTWKDLDDYLQYWFNLDTKDPSVMINPENYEMPENEIIQELESKGYKVSKMNIGGSLVVR